MIDLEALKLAYLEEITQLLYQVIENQSQTIRRQIKNNNHCIFSKVRKTKTKNKKKTPIQFYNGKEKKRYNLTWLHY